MCCQTDNICRQSDWLAAANQPSAPVAPWKDQGEMKEAVRLFAVESEALATSILQSDASQERTVHHHHHYSHPYSSWALWPFWYQPSVVVVGDRGSSNERSDAGLVLLGLAATVISGVGLYLLGGAIARYREAYQHLESARVMHLKLSQYGSQENIVEESKNLAVMQGRLSQRRAQGALVDIALRVSLTAGAVIALTGTLVMLAHGSAAAASALIVAGLVAGLISTGGMLFKCGLGNHSQRDQQEALLLQRSATQLLPT